ncbi:MAG: hypothetical protein LBI06_03935 [Treponema sp.]|jgi:hypothetical protein|nr:hypothetical protein [Treponema sp.]
MARMTDAEADALDELLTRTTPKIRRGEGGVFTRERDLLNALDPVAANYIRSRSEIECRSPAQIIGRLVRKELQPVEP